jgi:hypothetical protein
MKPLLLLLTSVGIAGCQSAPAPTVLAKSTKPVAQVPSVPLLPAVPPAPVSTGLQQKLRQQAQYIEALISQNDALTAKLTAVKPASPPLATVTPIPSEPIPLPRPAPLTPPPSLEPTLTPNADNVIDLVAFVVAEKPGEPVNPFTVRTVPPEATREVTLHVGGIIAGPKACAVINDHLVQAGEFIESLAVERIEGDAVLLRHSGRLLRLPVSEKATRVRLPL